MKWIQTTYVNGELKYEPRELSADDMVRRFAQIIFLKQSGDDIELHVKEHDDMYEVTQYEAIRKMKDRTVVHIYERKGDENAE